MTTHLNTDHEGEPIIPLSCYYKQGDDLALHVDASTSVPDALRAWAGSLSKSADELLALAAMIEESGENLIVSAGSSHAELCGVSARLARLALKRVPHIVPKVDWRKPR